jgi:hypothetical protein
MTSTPGDASDGRPCEAASGGAVNDVLEVVSAARAGEVVRLAANTKHAAKIARATNGQAIPAPDLRMGGYARAMVEKVGRFGQARTRDVTSRFHTAAAAVRQ